MAMQIEPIGNDPESRYVVGDGIQARLSSKHLTQLTNGQQNLARFWIRRMTRTTNNGAGAQAIDPATGGILVSVGTSSATGSAWIKIHGQLQAVMYQPGLGLKSVSKTLCEAIRQGVRFPEKGTFTPPKPVKVTGGFTPPKPVKVTGGTTEVPSAEVSATEVEALIEELTNAEAEEAEAPKSVVVQPQRFDPTTYGDPIEGEHRCLPYILKLIEANQVEGAGNVMPFLVGPAGSGKTHLAESVANALGTDLVGDVPLTGGASIAWMYGRNMPQGFISTDLMDMIDDSKHDPEQWTVFAFDELDAADANMLVGVNKLLSNGSFTNPINGKKVKVRKRVVLMAMANTFGTGSDTKYVGRTRLDAATIDRWRPGRVWIDYDHTLECKLVRDILSGTEYENQIDPLISRFAQMREYLLSQGSRTTDFVGMRAFISAAKMCAVGLPIDAAVHAYTLDWEESAKVACNIPL